MSSDNHLNLVSSIMNLASRFDPDVITQAKRYVLDNFQGSERDRLLVIIGELHSMSASRMSRMIPTSTREDRTPAQRSSYEPKDGETNGPELREVRAILDDVDFLPTKKDVLAFVRRILRQKVPERIERKSSRSDLVLWAIVNLEKESDATRRSVYQGARQAYLRRRRSSLSGWADNISGTSR